MEVAGAGMIELAIALSAFGLWSLACAGAGYGVRRWQERVEHTERMQRLWPGIVAGIRREERKQAMKEAKRKGLPA